MDTNEKINADNVQDIYCEEDAIDRIMEIVSDLLGVLDGDIEQDTKFSSMGFDSMMMIKLSERILYELNVEVRPHELFRYYNSELLGKHIYEKISRE